MHISDAPADALRELGVTAIEWSIAYSAALESRRSGKDPATLLAKAEAFFNDFTSDESGRRVYTLEAEVGGGMRR